MADCQHTFSSSDFVFSSEEDSDTSDNQSVCSSVSSVQSDLVNERPSSTTNRQPRNKGPRNRGPRNKGGKKGIVWVGNLPSDSTTEQLLEHFVSFKASICNKPIVHTPKDNASTSNRFSFIHFTTLEKANEVIQAMNGSKFHGRKLSIQLKERKSKSGKSSSAGSNPRSYTKDSVVLTTKAVTEHSRGGGSCITLQCSDSCDSDSESVCSSASSSIGGSDVPRSEKDSRRGRKKGKQQKFSVSVHNLPPDCTPQQILDHFVNYKSNIVNKTNIKILSSKNSSGNQQHNFTFLCINSLNKAKEVVEKMNKSTLQKKKLTLKLQETKEKITTGGDKKSTSSESSITGSSPLLTVKVYNIPRGIDKDDLRGLVANLQNTSCSVNGQEATLTFSSPDDAKKAVNILNKKQLCGVSLSASLTASCSSENKEKPSTVQRKGLRTSSKPSLLGSGTPLISSNPIPYGSVHPPTGGPVSMHPPPPTGGMHPPTGGPVSMHPSTGGMHPPTGGPMFMHPPTGGMHPPTGGPVSMHPSTGGMHPPTRRSISMHPPSTGDMHPPTRRSMSMHSHCMEGILPSPMGGIHHPPPMGGIPPTPPMGGIHPTPPMGGIHHPPPMGSIHPPMHSRQTGPHHAFTGQPPPIPTLPLPHQSRSACHIPPQVPQPAVQIISQQNPRRTSDGETKSKPFPKSHKHSEKREKCVASELYAHFCESNRAKINDFENNGGSIKYHECIVTINSPLGTEVVSMSDLLDSYSQKELTCSPDQWNRLVIVDQLGKRQIDELTEPFRYNPSVKIIEQPLKLIVIGLKDAVNGAYRHFFKNLNKDIKVDSSKLNILVQLEPNLPHLIHSLYGITIKGYTADSSSIELENVCEEADQIRSLIEEKLANISTVSLPHMSSPLVNSGRKLCSTVNLPIVIIDSQREIVLASSSTESLEVARNMLARKPCINMLQLSRYNETCMQFPFTDKFEFDYVSIRTDESKVILEGFFKEDVQSAKTVISKFLNENFQKEKERISEEILMCDEAQLIYLTQQLQSHESDQLFKSLPAKSILQEGKIVVNGSKEDITETSDRLLEMVPKHSKHVLEVNNSHFLKPLLKQHVLNTIDHIILPEERTGKERCHRMIVYLFDNDSTVLARIGDVLKVIDPGVLFFTISPKAKNVVKKVLNNLEKQQRCCIDLMKSGSAKVAIHGLTQEERDKTKAALQDYIDENYRIEKELPSPPITGLQMKYILLKHGEELKELGHSLRSYHYPFELAEIPAFGISPDHPVFFKVFGISKAVQYFEDAIDVFMDGFTVEKFCISLQNTHRFPWRKRWEALKQEARDSHTSLIEFKLPSYEEKDKPVLFAIYGNQAENVAQLKETIESEAKAGVAEGKLKLSSERVKQLQTALKDKQLSFDDYMVKVTCVEKDQIVFINSLKVTEDIVEVVKMEITGYLECTSNSSEEIIFPDIYVFVVFISKENPFFRESNSIARKLNVSLRTFRKGSMAGVCLKGSKVSVDTVKDRITESIEQIKASMGVLGVTADPLLECALTPTLISQLEEKLLNDYYVELRYRQGAPNQEDNEELKTVQIQLFTGSLKVSLSLCSGSITSQSTDVIVNSANEDLQNVRGVAKVISDKGGPIIQKECNEYIQMHGKVNIGDVVCTSSGKLACKRIVHAVPPEWHGGHNNEKESIYTAVFNSLSSSEGYTSISIPALGCGLFNVPKDACAEMSLKAVRDFFYCHTESSLAKVVFVLFEKGTQESFTKQLSEVFPSDSLLSKDETMVQPAASSTSIDTIWLWKNDHDEFSPYDSNTCKRISYEYQQNPRSIFYLLVNGVQYTINLQKMVQINMKTHFQRVIKMAGTSDVVASWHWTDDNGKLAPYTQADSAQLEKIHLSHSITTVVINQQVYIFDFKKMIQMNFVTGRKREIQRKIGTRYQVQECSEPPKISERKPLLITLYGWKSNLQAAKKFIKDQLQQMLKEDQIDLPFKLGQNFTNQVQQIGRKHRVTCEIQDRPRNTKVLFIRGVKTDLAVRDVQQYIIEQQNQGEDSNYPPEWQPQSNTTQIFPVLRGTPEWISVQQDFNKTLASCPIREIVRIQNIYLWEKWIEERNRIGKFKGCINEKDLFHGSGKNDPKNIYDSEIGFDMRFCSSGMWGQANYFAVNASYSHNYCHTNASGHHEMFLVKVITGDAYNCKSDRSLRMPPLKDGAGKLSLSQVRYDTVTGTTAGSQVYMCYDNQKAYPAYLIRY